MAMSPLGEKLFDMGVEAAKTEAARAVSAYRTRISDVYLLWMNDVLLEVFRSEERAVDAASAVMERPEFKGQKWEPVGRLHWACAAVASLAVRCRKVE